MSTICTFHFKKLYFKIERNCKCFYANKKWAKWVFLLNWDHCGLRALEMQYAPLIYAEKVEILIEIIVAQV